MVVPLMTHIRRSIFRRARTVVVNQSPFSAKVNRAGFQDWRWTFQFDYAPMRQVIAAPLLAAIASQGEGIGGLAGIYDPDYGAPLSAYPGTAVVYLSGQTGTSLNVAGSIGGITFLKANDKLAIEYPGIGYEMFTCLADVVLSGPGLGTVPLDAPMRRSPTGGAAIRFDFGNAVGITPLFRMTGYTSETDKDGFYTVSLSGEELV